MIPELGRSKRDVMLDHVRTVTELAGMKPETFVSGKKTVFAGVGPDTLFKFHDRAKLLITKDAKPFLRAPIHLPDHDRELFFDIEVDPLRDICYLHGFVERHGRDNATEKFVFFFAEPRTSEAEKRAFAEAWRYMKVCFPCAIYYYSKYERTLYRKLQAKYSDVCSADEIEDLFDPAHAIDLYNDVVKKVTEWPTWDFSIKTLAKYLGFSWRDTHPSGAASIEWFSTNRYRRVILRSGSALLLITRTIAGRPAFGPDSIKKLPESTTGKPNMMSSHDIHSSTSERPTISSALQDSDQANRASCRSVYRNNAAAVRAKIAQKKVDPMNRRAAIRERQEINGLDIPSLKAPKSDSEGGPDGRKENRCGRT